MDTSANVWKSQKEFGKLLGFEVSPSQYIELLVKLNLLNKLYHVSKNELLESFLSGFKKIQDNTTQRPKLSSRGVPSLTALASD